MNNNDKEQKQKKNTKLPATPKPARKSTSRTQAHHQQIHP
jgi:hypothetical protein